MNQIVQMFKESNTRMNKIMDGKFRLDEVSSAQREFEGQIKLVNAVVNAYAISSKNKRTLTGLNRLNLMDDTTAIDLMLGSHEVDKVKCPLQTELITRQECLDYSGSHYEECKNCEIGLETKRFLTPPIQESIN